MFTNDELEIITKAVRYYGDQGYYEEFNGKVTENLLKVLSSEEDLSVEETEREATKLKNERESMEERIILLQAKLIRLKDKMVAENV